METIFMNMLKTLHFDIIDPLILNTRSQNPLIFF